MSQQGAALQNYNNELVKYLCAKRDELQRQILIEEEDKHRLENEIRFASDKLSKINENLARKTTARTEFDQTIGETEAAYMKILESSQTLLNVLKRESHSLRNKVDD
ncbi:unnamed protein product [Rotaria magnacalcarata]